MHHPIRRTTAVGFLVVAALVLGACSATGGSNTSPTATSVVRPASSPHQALLERLGLSKDDLRKGEAIELMPAGDQVTNTVTLDYCGYPFRTEADRVGRRQALVRSMDPNLWASSEAVYYRHGQAAAALDEMREAVRTCPKGLRPSTVAGEPDMAYASTPVPESELRGLAADHFAIDSVATPATGNARRLRLIFQVRGDVLVGIYLSDPDRALAAAKVVAQRLAAATPSELGGS